MFVLMLRGLRRGRVRSERKVREGEIGIVFLMWWVMVTNFLSFLLGL